jgi:hypothetical protein
MTREYSHFTNPAAQHLLATLVDQHTSSKDYQQTLISLGETLGNILLKEIVGDQCSTYLASTVEDADFLAKGILNSLGTRLNSVGFACFWNQRSTPFGMADLTVAPIIKRYQEPTGQTVDYLIIIKSIISGGCVIKTNLLSLIQSIEPKHIFIVAPVIHSKAEQNLKQEFPEHISNKFQFLYLAKDDEINDQGEMLPGIGGMIYERLGFTDQDSKNRYVPELVKVRRAQQLQLQSR